MKHKLLPLALLFILLSSCGVQKRLYRSGFYIPDRSFSRIDHVEEAEPLQTDTLVAAGDATVSEATAEKEMAKETPVVASQPSLSALQTLTSYRKQFMKQALPVTLKASKAIIKKKQAGKRSDFDDDMLTYIGLGTDLGGIIFILAGSATKVTAPILSDTFIAIGVCLMILGTLALAIANPGDFIEILLDALIDSI